MSDDFPNRQSIRLPGYDYSKNGYYFITICTQNMENLFGDIKNGKMILNNAGKIVERWIMEITKKFSNTKIDIYQIMPNHIHAIIIIVGAGFSRPTQPPTKSPTLGQIIAYFKYESTKSINNMYGRGSSRPIPINSGAKTAPLHNVKFKQFFQRNFYEHIIRLEKEYKQIVYYIRSNPQNWERDKNNPVNIKFYLKIIIPAPISIAPKSSIRKERNLSPETF